MSIMPGQTTLSQAKSRLAILGPQVDDTYDVTASWNNMTAIVSYSSPDQLDVVTIRSANSRDSIATLGDMLEMFGEPCGIATNNSGILHLVLLYPSAHAEFYGLGGGLDLKDPVFLVMYGYGKEKIWADACSPKPKFKVTPWLGVASWDYYQAHSPEQ